ncbi:tetratricopeptide repeat protein [Phenylobacterium aquaticum]|uniref:tetratricopeptide repeat protein n=1 Tax=Phenylobacterium aquaticum TaxID=1763816 RepID=UPI001F5C3E00|nr:tetratricopeptide repeat protein [Phenylobacterium aquaticum]MCI3131795.1 tetratricopeptide repeat protein [Phenylobacterium aquaticum]
MRKLIFWALIALSSSLASTSAAQTWGRLSGVVTEIGQTGRTVGFRLDGSSMTFEFDAGGRISPYAALNLLQAAAANQDHVAVEFDPNSGIFADDLSLHLLVHELSYRGKSLAGQTSATPVLASDAQATAEAALARGMALSRGGDKTAARMSLDDALAADHLRPALLPMALAARSGLLYETAFDVRAGLDRDQVLFAGLTDARRWRSMAPESAQAASAVARGLSLLGDDEAALSIYADVIKRWPEEAFWSDISISSIHRRRGDYANALAAMDDIVRRRGPQAGMAYRFNRGRALLGQKRLPEAIKEFTSALSYRPTYDYAFIQRACAYAQSARLPEAVADLSAALTIQDSLPDSNTTGGAAQARRERLQQDLASLRKLAADSPHSGSDIPCHSYFEAEIARDPSPLLQK